MSYVLFAQSSEAPSPQALSGEALSGELAEAVFASDLPAGFQPTCDEIASAVRRARLRHGGIQGCVAVLATEFGDHPETAAPRMRWARQAVAAAYEAAGKQGAHRVRRRTPGVR